MVHQRVGPVHQKKVNALDTHQAQAVLDGGGDMGPSGVVIFDPCRAVPPHRRDDVTFGDNLDAVLQCRRVTKRGAQNFLGHVAAIDVGLVHRGYSLREAGLDLRLHMRSRGVGIIAKPPHAIDNPRQRQIIGQVDCSISVGLPLQAVLPEQLPARVHIHAAASMSSARAAPACRYDRIHQDADSRRK